MTQRALSRINLDCAAGNTAAYNTIRVFNNDQPQTRIRRPRCYSSGVTGTAVDPTTNSKRHALLSARDDLLSQTILACSFVQETTVPLFFERLQHSLTFGRLLSQPSTFSLSVYFCYVPTVVYGYSLLWERIVFCFRVVSVSI